MYTQFLTGQMKYIQEDIGRSNADLNIKRTNFTLKTKANESYKSINTPGGTAFDYRNIQVDNCDTDFPMNGFNLPLRNLFDWLTDMQAEENYPKNHNRIRKPWNSGSTLRHTQKKYI